MGSMPRVPSNLTIKQARFTKALLKQIATTGKTNLVKAAQESLDVKTYQSASQGASELLENPRIKDTIQQALLQIHLGPSELASEIKELATAKVEKISADVKLRSLVEILKLTGAYPTQKHANLNVSVKASLSNMQFQDLEKEVTRIDEELKSLVSEQSKANVAE